MDRRCSGLAAHELHLFFAPSRDEVEWAAARTDCDEHLLAQLLVLKPYQRMRCFPKLGEIPETVIGFVRRAVDLPESTAAKAANRTADGSGPPYAGGRACRTTRRRPGRSPRR
ncbi:MULTISPECIES: DUF4158 domain-containing protein [unclassified Streptomyces]|uniref:DUF4158 domain-containing protein n=1 Tax=unclassified Streptomyces TaxID=2593676 RepID=UPI00380EA68C